jgi:hypothetical protein
MDVSKIIIRDSSLLKTLGGLPPDFATFNDFLDHLKGIIASHPHKKLYVTGTSGGGHPALLLGHLLKADKVVAFAPYPYLSSEVGEQRNDPAIHSMKRMIARFQKLPNDVKPYFDLADVLVNWNGKTEYFVHVSRDNEADYTRAQYLQGLPKVEIVSHPYKEHAISVKLSNSGTLKDCFKFPYQQRTAEAQAEEV